MAGVDEASRSAANDLSTDPELNAIVQVHAALAPLDEDGRVRVLAYVCERLSLQEKFLAKQASGKAKTNLNHEEEAGQRAELRHENAAQDNRAPEDSDLEGISPIALKWLRRNGLEAASIASIYSLGLDDIDLVVEKVPGDSKKERARNVVRLVAIAGYLSTGVARASHERIKEACLHYDAYDVTNFSKALRSLEGEVSGTKESGYTLTPRGITAATQLIKGMIS